MAGEKRKKQHDPQYCAPAGEWGRLKGLETGLETMKVPAMTKVKSDPRDNVTAPILLPPQILRE